MRHDVIRTSLDGPPVAAAASHPARPHHGHLYGRVPRDGCGPTASHGPREESCRRGAHLPSLGREPVGGQTTEICDARPGRRQTYGYLPSRGPATVRARTFVLGKPATLPPSKTTIPDISRLRLGLRLGLEFTDPPMD